jgi:hypothetical protein
MLRLCVCDFFNGASAIFPSAQKINCVGNIDHSFGNVDILIVCESCWIVCRIQNNVTIRDKSRFGGKERRAVVVWQF